MRDGDFGVVTARHVMTSVTWLCGFDLIKTP
jgi:hypothetical protein